MENETIKVKVTESGQTMDVVVLNKRADRIQVVIGQGVHSVPCDLTPIKSKQAYVGSVMGREIVYERSCEQVQADLDKVNPALKKSRRF
ncbi:MAG: hypothetical protein WD709_03075 [Gammaproteobacteria bacterium]